MHTDLFPVGEDRVNPVYGFERTRAYGSADFAVYDDLTVGVGGEWRKTDRTGTRQEVMSEELLDGYGRAQYRPSGWLGFVVKGGVEERDPDNYDADLGARRVRPEPADAQVQPGVSLPRLRRAARRRRGRLAAGVARHERATTATTATCSRSMGLVAGLDRRFGIDLNWTVNEKISAYASRHAREDRLEDQEQQRVWLAGLAWRRAGRLRDLRRRRHGPVHRQAARSTSTTPSATARRTQTIEGAGAGNFPAVDSQLSSLKADVSYGFSPRADLVLTWWYESLETRDWQYQSEPAVLPTLLGLGVDPYNYDVNYVTLSLRYRFGAAVPPAEEEAAAE